MRKQEIQEPSCASPTVQVTLSLDPNMLFSLQHFVQNEQSKMQQLQQQQQQQIYKAVPSFKPILKQGSQPQKTVHFDERMEKVFIWEDYSNTSFTAKDSYDALANTERRNRIKRGRDEENEEEEEEIKVESPTKQHKRMSPQIPEHSTVVYDSKWFPELSLRLCLTKEDFHQVAIEYVNYLLQLNNSSVEHIKSQLETPNIQGQTKVDSNSTTENVEETTVEENTFFTEDEQTYSVEGNTTEDDNSVSATATRENILEMRRGSISELLHRRGSIDLLLGDTFISKSRRNSIDFASALLL